MKIVHYDVRRSPGSTLRFGGLDIAVKHFNYFTLKLTPNSCVALHKISMDDCTGKTSRDYMIYESKNDS